MRNSFGDVVTESVKMAHLLNYKFATLGDFKTSFPHKGDVACRNENFIRNLDSNFHFNFHFRFITKFECLRTIKTLNPNKPLGPTSIPAWALKDGAYQLAEPLTFLINSFIRENKFPSDLKKAHVVPLFKKDDPLKPENYRPISLTSSLSKLIEKLLQEPINVYLSGKN